MKKKHKFKSYCSGLFCLKADRKQKCVRCGSWICGECMKIYENNVYCPDCLVFYKINKFNNFLEKRLRKFGESLFYD